MDNKIIKFKIVTLERVVLEEDILQITVPTKEGEITVLANHIPLVASLQPGVIQIKKPSGEMEIISVSGGFIEVLKDKIVILADTAERAHEIDETRAEEAYQRAEEIKQNARQADRVNFTEINVNIAKELARTHAVKRWRKIKDLNNKNIS